jgi:hypothetical protein
MGILLYFISILLYIPLTIINLLFVLKKYGFKFKTFDGYFFETAIDIDKFGNRNFRTLWNATLIQENGYKFGKVNETISSALGKNLRLGTLSTAGKILAAFLDKLDPNHCIKSIDDTI